MKALLLALVLAALALPASADSQWYVLRNDAPDTSQDGTAAQDQILQTTIDATGQSVVRGGQVCRTFRVFVQAATGTLDFLACTDTTCSVGYPIVGGSMVAGDSFWSPTPVSLFRVDNATINDVVRFYCGR